MTVMMMNRMKILNDVDDDNDEDVGLVLLVLKSG